MVLFLCLESDQMLICCLQVLMEVTGEDGFLVELSSIHCSVSITTFFLRHLAFDFLNNPSNKIFIYGQLKYFKHENIKLFKSQIGKHAPGRIHPSGSCSCFSPFPPSSIRELCRRERIFNNLKSLLWGHSGRDPFSFREL